MAVLSACPVTAFQVLSFCGESGCSSETPKPASPQPQSLTGFGTQDLCRALSVSFIINFKKLSALWVFIVSGHSGK